MKDIAASYYSHFFFTSHFGKLHLALSPHAPERLKLLVLALCGDNPAQACLGRLYECLCSLAGQEAFLPPQEPSEEMFLAVDDYLRQAS